MTRLFFVCFFLSCFLLSVSGQEANRILLFECTAQLNSIAFGSLCTFGTQTNFSISPSIIGPVSVEVTSSAYYDTSICMMFGLLPDFQQAEFWSAGYCPQESLFVVKADKNASVSASCPKNTQTQTFDDHSAFRSMVPSRYNEGSTSSFDSFFSVHPTSHRMMMANNLPSTPKAPFTFIPRTTEEGDSSYYFIAAAITTNTFIGKGRSCTNEVSIQVYSQYVCPEGTVGPTCQPVNSVITNYDEVSPSNPIPPINPGTWSYFTFVNYENLVPSLKIMTNWVQSTKSSVSTYVRWEGVPYDNGTKTTKAFDQKVTTGGAKQNLVINNPRPGRYYIGFLNAQTSSGAVSGNFSIVATSCSKQNLGGAGCSTQLLQFSKLKKGESSVTSQKPTYIVFNSSSEIIVSVSTLAISAPSIYLGAGFVPNSTYFSLEANTGQKVNRISTGTLGQPVYWVLAVVAELQETIGFNVWIDTICFDNCTNNRGYCPGGPGQPVEFNPSGECKCNATKGKVTYENFACQIENNHNFQLEYIILIAVGGAIILAIVIGVPIYCFIHRRNSRQSGYQQL